jgi:hypothetical protein
MGGSEDPQLADDLHPDVPMEVEEGTLCSARNKDLFLKFLHIT